MFEQRKEYICGITIGPVYETILSANSPVSLWYSSILFSKIAFDIIKELKNRFSDFEVVSPYYYDNEDFSDGIGKYPDRIIFLTSNVEKDSLNCALKEVFDSVKRSITMLIKSDLNIIKNVDFSENYLISYFNRYLQFNYYFEEFDGKNFGKKIISIQSNLSFIELSKTFNKEIEIKSFGKKRKKKDPLIALYSGFDYNPNYMVKESLLFKSYCSRNMFNGVDYLEDNRQLESNVSPNLIKIEEFAKLANDKLIDNKIGKYIAFVKADGDNFGKYINSITDKEVMNSFSKKIYNFSDKVSKVIKDYGAAIYYVGGDDLLFLAPLKNNNKNKNIFDLCSDISELFNTELNQGGKNDLKISFGISIKYYKFPIYESLNISDDMLYKSKELFKSSGKGATSIHIFKNSSKGLSLAFKNSELKIIAEAIHATCKEEESVIRAVIYKLRDYSELFKSDKLDFKVNSCFDSTVDNIFSNILDAYNVDNNLFYEKFIKELYTNIRKNSHKYKIKVGGKFFYSVKNNIEDNLLVLITVLKISKLYIEEGGY